MDAGTERWQRHPNVLWRLGPDRVLVRPVAAPGLDLVGSAAVVWVALDQPRSTDELSAEFSQARLALTDDEMRLVIDDLVGHGLVCRAG